MTSWDVSLVLGCAGDAVVGERACEVVDRAWMAISRPLTWPVRLVSEVAMVVSSFSMAWLLWPDSFLCG